MIRSILNICCVFLSLSLAGTLIAQARPAARIPSELLFQVELHHLVPAEVAVKEGFYRIRIHNGRFVAPLDFVLDDPQAAKLFTAKTSERGLRIHVEIDLRPGRHVLSVPGYPELRSVLNVTPKGN